jgi:hypothetical protein
MPLSGGAGELLGIQSKVADAAAVGSTSPLNLSAPLLCDQWGFSIPVNTSDGLLTVREPTLDDATVVAISVPSEMVHGESYPVSITLHNAGQSTWTAASGHHLCHTSRTAAGTPPLTDADWGLADGTVPLPNDVPPGSDVTFVFEVTAPEQAGYYSCDWQMMLGGSTPFTFGDVAESPVYVVSFSDVHHDLWAWQQIEACVEAGIVQGYPDGTYHPELPVGRDQMAVYIARAIAIPTGEAGLADYTPSETPTFPDVDANHWAFKYVEYAYANSIVRGYGDGLYRPSVVVTRDQMAVYVSRAKGWVSIDDDMSTAPEIFPDVPAGFWAGTAIEACVDNGVVHGYDDGYYRPEWQVTRDQMAVYVARAFGLGM